MSFFEVNGFIATANVVSVNVFILLIPRYNWPYRHPGTTSTFLDIQFD